MGDENSSISMGDENSSTTIGDENSSTTMGGWNLITSMRSSSVNMRPNYELSESVQDKLALMPYSTTSDIPLQSASDLVPRSQDVVGGVHPNNFGPTPPGLLFHETDFSTGDLFPDSMMQNPSTDPHYLNQ
jgi:hypothetical protein